MKKILVLVIAVAMLASMAMPAMAAPATSEGVIRFVADGLDDLSANPGVFCPVDGGPTTVVAAPGVNRTGQWTGVLDFLNRFGSWGIDFGYREMPPAGTITWQAADAHDNASPTPQPLPRYRTVLGMGVQALQQPGPGLPPNPPTVAITADDWTLDVGLRTFLVANNPAAPTLSGFTMGLTVNTDVARLPGTFPGGFNRGPLSVATNHWYVHSGVDLVQTATPAATFSRVAEGVTGAVYGWEWLVSLTGIVGGNVSVGEARTELVWTFTAT